MLKISAVAFVMTISAIASVPAKAFQTIVTQVDKNDNGSLTYHFAIKLDQNEVLEPGDKTMADFVTVYNFYGFVDGSAKSPADWVFSSEQFGRTPTLNGYPLVLPVDVPNTPNLTWTAAKPIAAGASSWPSWWRQTLRSSKSRLGEKLRREELGTNHVTMFSTRASTTRRRRGAAFRRW